MPIKNIPSAPFINFLGSFLGPYDTQITDKSPLAIDHTLNQKFKLSYTSKTPPSLDTATRKISGIQRLPPLPKKTLPVLKAISPLPASKNTASESPIEHKPLTLPTNDLY